MATELPTLTARDTFHTFGRSSAALVWCESTISYAGGFGRETVSYARTAKRDATAAIVYSRNGEALGLVSLPSNGCAKYGAHALGRNTGATYSTLEGAVKHFV